MIYGNDFWTSARCVGLVPCWLVRITIELKYRNRDDFDTYTCQCYLQIIFIIQHSAQKIYICTHTGGREKICQYRQHYTQTLCFIYPAPYSRFIFVFLLLQDKRNTLVMVFHQHLGFIMVKVFINIAFQYQALIQDFFPFSRGTKHFTFSLSLRPYYPSAHKQLYFVKMYIL